MLIILLKEFLTLVKSAQDALSNQGDPGFALQYNDKPLLLAKFDRLAFGGTKRQTATA